MLAAIVLAAGAGRRFGGGKLIATWQGAPLLHAALQSAFEAPVERVDVVVGADGDAVAGAARAFDARAHIVVAEDHAEGMAASLRAGIASLPIETAGAFIFLGDMPRIPHDVPNMLADALGVHDAVVPTHAGRNGHPVLFARAAFPALLALKGDVGAKSVLQALGDRVAYIDVDDPGVLFDVDTREDLK